MPKPFPEPVDGCVSDDCSIYSPSNSSEDLESDDESCNTPEERNDSLFLKASFLVLSHSMHNVEK